ncbi:hypothetical protein ACWEKM_02810 [Streptomyces sp. NPDC004752]
MNLVRGDHLGYCLPGACGISDNGDDQPVAEIGKAHVDRRQFTRSAAYSLAALSDAARD